MTDRQLLYLTLVLLYFSECFFWISFKGVVFRKSYSSWKVVFANALFGNEKGGLALAYPLPFLGRLYITYVMPVSFSADGVLNISIESLSAKLPLIPKHYIYYKYSDINSVENSGKELLINGVLFCKCGSSVQAKMISAVIGKVLKSKNVVAELNKELKQIFNSTTIGIGLNIINRKTKVLTVLCNIQFYILFVLAPLLVYLRGSIMILWIAAYLLISNIALITIYYLKHKIIYPELARERIADAFKMFFCPPLSIRATDLITAHMFSAYHPVALASKLLNPDDFKLFAKQAVLSHNIPPKLLEDEQQKNTFEWHLNMLADLLKKQLKETGLDFDELRGSPEKEQNSESYCPRCHAQFTTKDGQCPDCSGIILTGWDLS